MPSSKAVGVDLGAICLCGSVWQNGRVEIIYQIIKITDEAPRTSSSLGKNVVSNIEQSAGIHHER
ncbi:hypothetical protein EST38_g14354 [Candolleomyces aberdarensis]|uniref:Uncharacterized protein n=1 Tax=Candolleomyces aberdarensis TaxID=2316362 RepID=A0A4Q2CZW5_9AGAR|nr:hypothetical protein EST38_g14354 [Candolleomyces aberdarensis]